MFTMACVVHQEFNVSTRIRECNMLNIHIMWNHVFMWRQKENNVNVTHNKALAYREVSLNLYNPRALWKC